MSVVRLEVSAICLADYWRGSPWPVICVPVTGSYRAWEVKQATQIAAREWDGYLPHLGRYLTPVESAGLDKEIEALFSGVHALSVLFPGLPRNEEYEEETPYLYLEVQVHEEEE